MAGHPATQAVLTDHQQADGLTPPASRMDSCHLLSTAADAGRQAAVAKVTPQGQQDSGGAQ